MKKPWNVRGHGLGGFFDLSSLAGVAKGVLFCFVLLIFGWNVGLVYDLFGSVFLGGPIILSDYEIKRMRGVAIFFAGGGVFIGSIYFVILCLSVLRARASCKGQWYEGISKEELYSEGSKSCEDENDKFLQGK